MAFDFVDNCPNVDSRASHHRACHHCWFHWCTRWFMFDLEVADASFCSCLNMCRPVQLNPYVLKKGFRLWLRCFACLGRWWIQLGFWGLVASVEGNLGMRLFAQPLASFAKSHGIIDQRCCKFGSDPRQIWLALYLQFNMSFCSKTVDPSSSEINTSMASPPNKPKMVSQSSLCAPPFASQSFKNCVAWHAHSWFQHSSNYSWTN